jgi:hypothetical protein
MTETTNASVLRVLKASVALRASPPQSFYGRRVSGVRNTEAWEEFCSALDALTLEAANASS